VNGEAETVTFRNPPELDALAADNGRGVQEP
jgi:hypothetical protein